MLFADIDQQDKYHQEKIRLFYNDLPVEHVFKILSITIVIKSLIGKNNKFYLEISLNHCLYEIKS